MSKQFDKDLVMPTIYGRDEWVDHLNNPDFFKDSEEEEECNDS